MASLVGVWVGTKSASKYCSIIAMGSNWEINTYQIMKRPPVYYKTRTKIQVAL